MKQKPKGRPGVILYFDRMEALLAHMSAEQAGFFIIAIIQYAHYGVHPDFSADPVLAMAFDSMIVSIDLDAERYQEVSLLRRYAVHVREAKRAGVAPLSKEEWAVQALSDDSTRYPTPTPTATPAPTPTTTPAPKTTPTPNTKQTPESTPTPAPRRSPFARLGLENAPEDPAERCRYILDTVHAGRYKDEPPPF